MSPDERFSKKEHLLKKGEFRAVYKKGRSVSCASAHFIVGKGDPVLLHFMPNARTYSRIGFSLGVRYIRHASTRNRLKRLFRESYRREKNTLKKGYDLIITIKAGLLHNDIMLNDISKIFQKLTIMAHLEI